MPGTWPFANPEWLTTLPGFGAGVRVLAYEYPSPFIGNKPSWEPILMLGYGLLEILSDARSGSDPDLVSGFYWIYSRSSAGILADVPCLDYQEADFVGLSQLGWPYSQAIFVRC